MTSRCNVLVFPACNEPGLEAIHALRKSNKINLFGGSSYNLRHDPARHLLQNYLPCPGIYEEGFEERFRDLLAAHDIHVVFPTMDILVSMFARWSVPNAVFVTPSPDVADVALSKRATYARLQGVVPVPRLYLPEDNVFPLFGKPDKSGGSRGTMEITGPAQLRVAVEQELLLCEFLPGEEYTVDCISDLDGELLFANVRVRGRIGRGIALGTSAAESSQILTYVRRVADVLRIKGPWFAQFKENDRHEPVLTEFNARIAGSMTLTRMCGVNIPLLAFFIFTGHTVRVPTARRDVLLNRSLCNFVESSPIEWVIWDWDDTIIRKDGKPDPDVIACLYDLNNRGIGQALVSRNPQLAELIEAHHIPPFFVEKRYGEDKIAEIGRLMERHSIEPRTCVIVNDSYSELFALQECYPSVRIVTPDALELLGRERQ